MNFVSYAQNFEDVMLWRALGAVEQGFYVDVGANDPVVDSVTKAFYDRGWNGINVEPVEQWFRRLVEERGRDINLQVALGAEKGAKKFYEIVDTGLSTFSEDFADRHVRDMGYSKVETTVEIETLAEIIDKYGSETIHFLKVDVEGYEWEVIQGIDLNAVRPWIILVEATLPNSEEIDCAEWESALLSCDYDFVYFDGLNRFYLAKEHGELRKFFETPPNVFDNFHSARELLLESELTENSNKISMLASENNDIRLLFERSLEELKGSEFRLAEQRDLLEAANSDRVARGEEVAELKARVKSSQAELDEALISLKHRELSAAAAKQTLLEQISGAQEEVRSWKENSNKWWALSQSQITEGKEIERQRDEALISLRNSELSAAAGKEALLEQISTALEDARCCKEDSNKWWALSQSLTSDLQREKEWSQKVSAAERHWRYEADRLERELSVVYASKSWFITWPLRKINWLVKLVVRSSFRLVWLILCIPKNAIKWITLQVIRVCLSRPKLRWKLTSILNRVPWIKHHLRLLALNSGIGLEPPSARPQSSRETGVLAPAAELEERPVPSDREEKIDLFVERISREIEERRLGDLSLVKSD